MENAFRFTGLVCVINYITAFLSVSPVVDALVCVAVRMGSTSRDQRKDGESTRLIKE